MDDTFIDGQSVHVKTDGVENLVEIRDNDTTEGSAIGVGGGRGGGLASLTLDVCNFLKNLIFLFPLPSCCVLPP